MIARRIAYAAALIAAVAPAAPAAAQDHAGHGGEDPSHAVLATIERMFEGMRTADSAMTRSAMADQARFAMIGRDGNIQVAPVDGWIEAIAGSEGRWDERIYDSVVQVDMPIASAWTPYTFYLDGQVRHCGVNTIELLFVGGEWKVTQISDSRRQEDCPDPLGAGTD